MAIASVTAFEEFQADPTNMLTAPAFDMVATIHLLDSPVADGALLHVLFSLAPFLQR